MYFIGTLSKFFVWWYSEGLVRLFKYQGAYFAYISNLFSVRESLAHLFSPWKRLVGPRRTGLDGLRDWMLDNLVSRGIGFFLRLALISIFLAGASLWMMASIIFLIIWVLWPVLIPILVAMGVASA